MKCFLGVLKGWLVEGIGGNMSRLSSWDAVLDYLKYIITI
jgi:hypothetical protein